MKVLIESLVEACEGTPPALPCGAVVLWLGPVLRV